jgi:hypothetical protein
VTVMVWLPLWVVVTTNEAVKLPALSAETEATDWLSKVILTVPLAANAAPVAVTLDPMNPLVRLMPAEGVTVTSNTNELVPSEAVTL